MGHPSEEIQWDSTDATWGAEQAAGGANGEGLAMASEKKGMSSLRAEQRTEAWALSGVTPRRGGRRRKDLSIA